MLNPYRDDGLNMEKQTFAKMLSLPLLQSLVCLTSIKGFDAWLLRQAHRPDTAWASSGLAKQDSLRPRVTPLMASR
jgi:hypothetical protein